MVDVERTKELLKHFPEDEVDQRLSLIKIFEKMTRMAMPGKKESFIALSYKINKDLNDLLTTKSAYIEDVLLNVQANIGNNEKHNMKYIKYALIKLGYSGKIDEDEYTFP